MRRILMSLVVVIVVIAAGAVWVIKNPAAVLPAAIKTAGQPFANHWFHQNPVSLTLSASAQNASRVAVSNTVSPSEHATALAVGEALANKLPSRVTLSSASIQTLPAILRPAAQNLSGQAITVGGVTVTQVQGSPSSGTANIAVQVNAGGSHYQVIGIVTLSQGSISGVQSLSVGHP